MNRVVLVEDTEADRYLMRRMLQPRFPSLEFVELEDGERALEYFRSAEWFTADRTDFETVLITDINMPRVNGFQFLERLGDLMTERGIHPDAIPIAVLSSSSAWSDRKRAAEISIVDECLCKPIDIAKLQGLVGQATAARAA